MSCSPNYTENPNAVFLDAHIQRLVLKLKGVTLGGIDVFEDLVFGLAERNEETGEPLFFIGNDRGQIENQSLEPNDNWKAFAFFYESGPRVQRENVGQYKYFDSEISLIIWFNQRELFPHPYRIRENLINEVLRALRGDTTISNVRIFTQRNEIFGQFNLNENTRRWVSAPFDGFRLTFSKVINANCSTVSPATSTKC
jgi:hypothetical protein